MRQPEYSTKVEKVYGLEFLGPRAPSGSIVRIDADYYAPDNGIHESSDRFIRVVARLDRAVGLPGEKGTPPERTTFKGRAATKIIRTTYDFVRDTNNHEKQVTIIEEYLVIPAKEGFYVLEYTAPPALVKEYRPVFENSRILHDACGSIRPHPIPKSFPEIFSIKHRQTIRILLIFKSLST